MRNWGLLARAVIVLTLVALTFVGSPVGPPVSSGEWPSLTRVLGFGPSSAEASVAVRQAVPPRAARVGLSSGLLAKPGGKPVRVRELGWQRTETTRRFEMSDGSTQVELSSVPLHYRDGKGRWREIDTSVVAGAGGDAFKNATNAFASRFGKSTDRLAAFELGGFSIAMGAAGDKRPVTPKASGSTVTVPDVFGTADVRYRVLPTGLKEDIVLADRDEVADEYRFELSVQGLVTQQRSDGSIWFLRKKDDNRPVLVMPAPFMRDSSKANQLGEPGYSDAVTQTLTQRGGTAEVTIKPDAEWLANEDREWPVVIDPTITVAPNAAAAQDTMLSQTNPTVNYGSSSNLTVGRGAAGDAWRSLVKFDLSEIPTGKQIRSADLNLHMGNPAFGDTVDVPLSVHEATAAWSESAATWSSMASSYSSAVPFNQVQVDDQDALSTSYDGPWEDSANTNAVGGSMAYLAAGSTADTFTWNARVPSAGDYKVEAHYIPNTTRGTVDYTVTGDKGTTTAAVNQTSGASTGQWAQLAASHHFAPGQKAQVMLTRRTTASTTAVADAVRWTEYGKQTRAAGQRDAWHSYAVGSLVQKWVDTPSTHHGFLLKGTDDSSTGPTGGAYYAPSEDAFNGETAHRPTLVITYDEPGVDLAAPKVIRASGAELTWSKYVDPTPKDEDDLVEYQIFRGCVTLPGGACPSTKQVGEYYRLGDPTRYELVGTVSSDVTAFTDTTAKPSTPAEQAVYHYWVVARTVADTANGKDGRAASNVQVVTIPREGRIVRALDAGSDTTLSSALPTTPLERPSGDAGNTKYFLQVGRNHPDYGDERTVLEFDTSAIKQGVKVTDARLQLYQNSGGGSGDATFDLHSLTKDFVEGEATWNKATSTINWASAGGDYTSSVLGSATTDKSHKRVNFDTDALTGAVQSWVDTPGDNHGLLLRTRDEAAAGYWYLNFTNGESPDDLFRPLLYVEHLTRNDSETYQADEIPQRFAANTTVTTPVTVTNTSTSTWPSDLKLSYRWTAPGGTGDLTTEGERNYVPLGKALASGESVRLDLPIRTPINSDSGAKRLAYDLYLDLWTGSGWFSATNPPSQNTTRPTQGCAVMKTGYLCVDRYVETPATKQFGLEKFLSYAGEETGAGSQMLANLYTGNVVWSYDALSNPSLGPSTFVRLAYNSMDVTDPGAGFGWSVQPGTMTRLGSTLSVPSGGSVNNEMSFIDGDGTTHTYKHDGAKSTSSRLAYTRPPGVALELYRDLTQTDPAKQWVLHRPDGTRFYYNQDTGRPTAVVDRNGNTLTYTHDASGRLTTITDAAGRTTLTLGYNAAGLEWIRDISGRALKFHHNSSHQLIKLEDGGAFDSATKTFGANAPVKTFLFGHTSTSTNDNAKLNSVTDPRGKVTTLAYFTSTENSTYANWPKRYTDRRGNDTTFAYSDPDSSAAKDIVAEVTDVNGTTPSVTTYRMDGYGRTTKIRDANANAEGKTDQVTRLGWDTDHNVTRLEEPNGAVSTWRYDNVTGYPLQVRDAMSVKNGGDGIVLTYESLATPAAPTVLKSKTSAAGRITTFTYDTAGNLKTVRNGLGHGPTYTYNANGTPATVTDANGGVTTFANYDNNGLPKSITDPLNHTSAFDYDVRGNVLTVTDPLGRVTIAEYDAFGRPERVTTPHEGSETRTTVTGYDLNDNVTSQTAPNGSITTSTYGDADNMLTASLPDNNLTSRTVAYTYDPLGRVDSETAPNGTATTGNDNDFITKYSYDRIGQTLEVATPFVDTDGSSKTAVTSYTYDVVGNPITVIDPNKSATPATDYTTKTTYDLNHRATAVTDAAGYTSKSEYDADGLLTAEIDALGNKRRTVYDKASQPTEVHVPHTPAGSSTTEDRVTKYAYDAVGNVVREIRPSGKYSETVHDKNNQPVQTKSAFDANSTNYKTPASTFFKYDDAGQLISQSAPTFGTAGTEWTDHTYHPSGALKSSTDPWDITTTFNYDKLGKQTRRTMTAANAGTSRVQSWGYYPDGSLATRSDTAAAEPVKIIDNKDSWRTAKTGTERWTGVSGGTNAYGTGYLVHAAAAAGTPEAEDYFKWKVTVNQTGAFDVLVSCPVRTDTTTSATYTITHSGGTSTKTINQKTCTSSTPWVSLGNYTFPGGSTRTVVLNTSPTGAVVADAVKLVATDPAAKQDFTYAYDANGAVTEVKDATPGAVVDAFATSYDGLGRTKQVRELSGVVAKRETDYTYDLNSNVTSTYARRPAGADTTGTSRYTGYSWDVRNLIETVKSGATPTSSLDTWTYLYDARGMRTKLTKPNGNTATASFHEDGLLRTMVERTSEAKGSRLISSHTLKYTADGDRQEDVSKIAKPKSTASWLDEIARYGYTPNRQLGYVTKTGAEKGENESYTYDAAGNVTKQTIGSVTSTMSFDRNRLTQTVTGSTTVNHQYDVFGRATTTSIGADVISRNNYDGFDRLIRQREWDSAGVHQHTKDITLDPFDRTSRQTTRVTTKPSVTTRFVYLGMRDQVASEEQTNTAGEYETSKVFTHGPGGEKLALVDTPVNGTTTSKRFYGTNPHTDVETLTNDSTGLTEATYRYTAYGNPDTAGTLGEDAVTGDPVQDAEVVNPYRFNSKRFDGATGTYDMGFREYDPGLNRFLSRDMYNGALADMRLGSDPWNSNRYAFAGGNPISGVEMDGHEACHVDCDIMYGGRESKYVSEEELEIHDLRSEMYIYENVDTSQSSVTPDTYWESKARLGDAEALRRMETSGKPMFSLGEVGHFLLDAAGMVPVIGELADGANCGWYSLEGNAGDAALSCAAMVPVVGSAATVGKYSVKLGDAARTCFKSFSGTTLVLMADGSKKPIEDVEVGDEVIATDPETGEQRVETVKRVFVHADTVIDLLVDGEVITTTEDHPFWSVTDQRFEDAQDLAPGELVLTADWRTLRVGGLLLATSRRAAAYNLEITNIHTYHVGIGHVLVHNSCGIFSGRLDNIAAHITTRDLTAAERELRGEIVKRKADGTPWNHVHEVRDAQNGLMNIIARSKAMLADGRINDAQRAAIQADLSRASIMLDHTERYVPR